MPYTADDFIHVAELLRTLPPQLMHTDFYAARERMIGRLYEAAHSPNGPRSAALMEGVKFMVYAPFTTSPTILEPKVA